MMVIFSVERMLKMKKVFLRYYNCNYFTYDRNNKILYAPFGAKQFVIMRILSEI